MSEVHPATDAYARHVNPALVDLLGVLGYGRVFVRAEGCRLFDDRGREYLDFLAGFGAASFGHGNPRLTARLAAQLAGGAPGLVHTGPAPEAAALARELCRRLPEPLSICLFATSGAEAVEAGLKLARAATGRAGFVHCKGGFHGSSLATLSVMGHPRMRAPFEPLLAATVEVAFGDLAGLEAALAPGRAAAFVVEPIQAEAGVVLPPAGYLAAASDLCRRAGTLLVLDEVQTGLGRTGTRFAFEAEGFVPDVLCLGKALGGGLVPVSVAVVRRDHHRRAYGAVDRFDLHGSTYAGYALGSAAAREALDLLDGEGLAERARTLGAELLEALTRRLAGHPLVRQVRGRGLLVGIELGPTGLGLFDRAAPRLVETVAREVFGQWLALRLLEKGILAQPCALAWNVLKLEPPLTVARADLQVAVEAVAAVLAEYPGVVPVLRDAAARVVGQALAGGGFR